MRTMVDPAATAASRSSLIPIERSSRPSVSANRPTVSKAARAAGRAWCRHRHETPHVQPQFAQPAHQFPHARRGTPVAARKAARVDLH